MNLLREPFRPEMEKHCEMAMYMHGGSPPSDTRLMIVRNTDDVWHFVLPPDPNQNLADDDLSAVAGGACGAAGCRSSLVSCIGGC